MTRRWSRPDVLLGLSLLTGLAITLRLELLGLLAPLALQSWLYDRVDWLEGLFSILFTAVSCTSQSLPAKCQTAIAADTPAHHQA